MRACRVTKKSRCFLALRCCIGRRERGQRERRPPAFSLWVVGIRWLAWVVVGSQVGPCHARTCPAWQVASRRTGWSTQEGELWLGDRQRRVLVPPRVARPPCSWVLSGKHRCWRRQPENPCPPAYARAHTCTHIHTLSLTPSFSWTWGGQLCSLTSLGRI